MIQSSSIAIRAEKLSRDFGTTNVLKDLSLKIETGSVCALLGTNGAGKTTLLKLLMGLIQPTSGSSGVLWDVAWPRDAKILQKTGCLLDGFEPPRSTQIRHLMDISRAIGPQFDESLVQASLSSHGLAMHRRWSTLSKGQKRWVLLAMLLCRKCEVLLLDEPADGLDPQSRIELYQLIRRHANDRGVTALIATHVIGDIERVADQVCILHRKSILLHADLEELREQVHVIEFDSPPSLVNLPEGIDCLHEERGEITSVWLRDRSGGIENVSFEHEVRRRRASLEELFIAMTGRL
jgi:ABC-2 type transport system ATP-binding protein